MFLFGMGGGRWTLQRRPMELQGPHARRYVLRVSSLVILGRMPRIRILLEQYKVTTGRLHFTRPPGEADEVQVMK